MVVCLLFGSLFILALVMAVAAKCPRCEGDGWTYLQDNAGRVWWQQSYCWKCGKGGVKR